MNGLKELSLQKEAEYLIQSNPDWLAILEKGQFELDKAKSTLLNWANIYTETTQLDSKTIEQALGMKTPSLATIKKYRGDIMAIGLLVEMLRDVADYFTVGKNMNDRQLRKTARIIYSDYFYYTLADFKLCFDNACKGTYGKLYGQLDGSVISLWLAEYDKERIKTAEDLAEKEHERIEENAKAIPMPPKVMQKFKDFEQKRKVKMIEKNRALEISAGIEEDIRFIEDCFQELKFDIAEQRIFFDKKCEAKWKKLSRDVQFAYTNFSVFKISVSRSVAFNYRKTKEAKKEIDLDKIIDAVLAEK